MRDISSAASASLAALIGHPATASQYGIVYR